MADATFEEGAERPVRLTATDTEDLGVLAAMVQDSVFPITEIRWDRARRRFAILLNRFRWEDRLAAERRGRAYERVQSLLIVEDVLHAASQGIDRRQADTVLSLLTLDFQPADDGAGRLELTLAGDGAIALDVECLNVSLRDVSRPYAAPSGHVPDHGV